MSCIYFSERDEIQIKRIYNVSVAKEGSSTCVEKIDLDQKVSLFFEDLCKKYFYTPHQWEVCKSIDEKETGTKTL